MSTESPDGSAPAQPTETERQRAVDALCEAFADDRLSVEEFEHRVELAHGTASASELQELLTDLPAVHRQPVRRPDDAQDDASYGVSGVPARATDDRDFALPPLARPDEVADHGYVMGIMGGGGRDGRWIPARTLIAVGIMGGVELDFRDAIFAPGVTHVRVVAFMGGVELVVPPGVRVESSGIGIMGGFEEVYTVPPTSNPDAPVLRVSGLGLMGGVQLTVRYSGESGRDAKRRLREERKAMKRLKRGR